MLRTIRTHSDTLLPRKKKLVDLNNLILNHLWISAKEGIFLFKTQMFIDTNLNFRTTRKRARLRINSTDKKPRSKTAILANLTAEEKISYLVNTTLSPRRMEKKTWIF